MKLLRGKHGDASHGIELDFARSADSLELLVPLGDMQQNLVCWACIAYRASDPLVTELSIRSPRRAPVVERTLLRRDLRRFARSGGEIPGLSIERRPDPDHLTVSFHEGDLMIPAVIPATAVEAFLRESEDLVSFDPRDEAEAIDRAFTNELKRSSPRT